MGGATDSALAEGLKWDKDGELLLGDESQEAIDEVATDRLLLDEDGELLLGDEDQEAAHERYLATTTAIKWTLASRGADCETACKALTKTCDATKLVGVVTTAKIEEAAEAAGYACKKSYGPFGGLRFAGTPS